jgi:FkbM family methyltransferase
MARERIVRALFRMPVLRRLSVRRWLWERRRDAGGARRRLFELFGSDRYSHTALHEMDRKLARRLDWREGFFVEAGAYDGVIQSNTYWLERFRGWRGVLVEPVPHLYRQARRRRSAARVFNCALVPPDHDGNTVSMRYAGLMSIVAGVKGGGEQERAQLMSAEMNGWDDVAYEITAPARTLTAVLDEAGAPSEIDLLSLDVEGYEASVLRGLDFGRYRPRFMLIEMDDPAARRPEVEAVIGDSYDLVEPLSPGDLLYERRT